MFQKIWLSQNKTFDNKPQNEKAGATKVKEGIYYLKFVSLKFQSRRCDPVGDNVTWPRIT